MYPLESIRSNPGCILCKKLQHNETGMTAMRYDANRLDALRCEEAIVESKNFIQIASKL